MAASVSFTVEPVAAQPGKSGTYAEKFAPASSITTAYFMGVSLILKASLFKDTVESSGCQSVAKYAASRLLSFIQTGRLNAIQTTRKTGE